ncbi:hypothetical protein D3C78_1498140 [compost metagenome]
MPSRASLWRERSKSCAEDWVRPSATLPMKAASTLAKKPSSCERRRRASKSTLIESRHNAMASRFGT